MSDSERGLTRVAAIGKAVLRVPRGITLGQVMEHLNILYKTLDGKAAVIVPLSVKVGDKVFPFGQEREVVFLGTGRTLRVITK
jgi:hypothetical protein